MTKNELTALFLEKIPCEYPKHMFCYFAENAVRGNILPFTQSLLRVLGEVDEVVPGYAITMLDRMAGIKDTGESQYESLIQILAEIYVTAGVLEKADVDSGTKLFGHEPGPTGMQNPEFEARIAGHWCAVEVKTPQLIQHGRIRSQNDFQVAVRLPRTVSDDLNPTLPRDNPVKDFLISAEDKFAVYEQYRPKGFRILVIVWDDFCNEPIAALNSPQSGLLTPKSFHRSKNDEAITYPHIDGIVVVRYQHQIIRATRCEPLIDGAVEPLRYHHDGFPPKAFIQLETGRKIPGELVEALNAIPLSGCLGAEYHPVEIIMWADA